jgi:hypothetical protein
MLSHTLKLKRRVAASGSHPRTAGLSGVPRGGGTGLLDEGSRLRPSVRS